MFVLFHLAVASLFSQRLLKYIYYLYHVGWSRPIKKIYNNEFANDLCVDFANCCRIE